MFRNGIFTAFAVGVYWFLKLSHGKREGTVSDRPNSIFSCIALAVAVGLIFGTSYFGTKRPGSFFERDDYEGMFYVNLFPEGQEVKSYRVPAMITARVGETEYGDDIYSWREYRIDFAAMPNGGKIAFDISDETLELGKKVTVVDNKERYWGVKLTEQPVK